MTTEAIRLCKQRLKAATELLNAQPWPKDVEELLQKEMQKLEQEYLTITNNSKEEVP
jgi:hypothetical protein